MKRVIGAGFGLLSAVPVIGLHGSLVGTAFQTDTRQKDLAVSLRNDTIFHFFFLISVLGPLLLLVDINDLPYCLRSFCKTLLMVHPVISEVFNIMGSHEPVTLIKLTLGSINEKYE